MNKIVVSIFTCLLFSGVLFAQTISGNLSLLANQELRLEGFDGFKNYSISKGLIDNKGNFQLNYTSENYGVGYLISSDQKPFFVLLTGETIEIKGTSLGDLATLKILNGKENQWFEQYSLEQPRREQALSAWLYLENMYLSDDLFTNEKKTSKTIQKEQKRIKEEELQFLNSLPKNSYVRWFLPIRKLVSNVKVVATIRTNEIQTTKNELRSIDYLDARLYKSGLISETLENHVWFLENTSGTLENVYSEINQSIDVILNQLVGNEKLFNEVSKYLFSILEKHSLYTSSEYLALKVLNEQSCSISTDLANQLEGYRKLKKGTIAPDIEFGAVTYYPEGVTARKLSELKSDYTVVVFAAGWCSHCTKEIPEISKNYAKWNKKGIEVVLVSLDETPESFANFTASLPFISTTDYKKWESKAVQDYHIFGTPTLFILDTNRKIILRPTSVSQLDAWTDLIATKN